MNFFCLPINNIYYSRVSKVKSFSNKTTLKICIEYTLVLRIVLVTLTKNFLMVFQNLNVYNNFLEHHLERFK